MMTSYLAGLLFAMQNAHQLVFQNDDANLLHLVGFRLVSLRLQIEDFLHALFPEDYEMAPSNALLEAQPFQ